MKRIVKLLKNCVGRGRITQALLTRKCMSTLEMVWKRGKNCTASFNWNVYLNVLLNASAQKADFIMALFKELFFEMFYERLCKNVCMASKPLHFKKIQGTAISSYTGPEYFSIN